MALGGKLLSFLRMSNLQPLLYDPNKGSHFSEKILKLHTLRRNLIELPNEMALTYLELKEGRERKIHLVF